MQLEWRHQVQPAGFDAAIDEAGFPDRSVDASLRVPQRSEGSATPVHQGEAAYRSGHEGLISHSPRAIAIVAVQAYLPDPQGPIATLNRLQHRFNPQGFIEGDVAAMTVAQADEVNSEAVLGKGGSDRERTWFSLVVIAGVVLVGAVLLVSLRVYRLNQALAAEVNARKAANEALQASEQRYRLLVEATPFPIAISRLEDGRIRFLNPAAGRQFEVDPSSAEDHTAIEFYTDPSVRRQLVDRLQAHGRVQRFETRMRSARGNVFWAELTATKLMYEGEPCAFVAITDISARKDVEKSLRHLAETDPLTGLWNRRKFFELLQIEQARVHRYHRPGTVLSLDIDHFKAVNDRHGHAIGDAMLVHFAHLIRQQLRLVDIVGRIGGEEFAVILPETDRQAAWQVAEKLRATVEATPLVLESGQKIPVTVSLGLAVLEGASNTDTVMLAADQALYRAKSQGRNAIAV